MNLYRLFRSLIPEAPLLVGEVTATSDGIATVELPDGGLVHARGAGSFTVGSKVFVRDGMIEGDAPDLTVEVIDV